jgi:hypothetical protein
LLKVLKKASFNIYKNSNKILISSQGYRDDLLKIGISNDRIFYWPQYHEEFYQPVKRDFNKTVELNPKKFNIIFTGNFGLGQGLLEFLMFINEYKIQIKNMEIVFNFLGDGKEKNNLISYINDKELKGVINIIPAKKPEEIPQYLANSEAALLLIKDNSIYE